MTNKKKEVGVACGRTDLNKKTRFFPDGEEKVLSDADSSTASESIQANMEAKTRPRKIVRCFRFFACGGHFGASRMGTGTRFEPRQTGSAK